MISRKRGIALLMFVAVLVAVFAAAFVATLLIKIMPLWLGTIVLGGTFLWAVWFWAMHDLRRRGI